MKAGNKTKIKNGRIKKCRFAKEVSVMYFRHGLPYKSHVICTEPLANENDQLARSTDITNKNIEFILRRVTGTLCRCDPTIKQIMGKRNETSGVCEKNYF